MNPAISFDTRDEFNRKKIAEQIIQLLKSDLDLSPMLIKGNWGVGKTEFCLKMIKLMQNGDNSVNNTHAEIVYIDAFKADHNNEPLLTILAKIIDAVPTNKKSALIKRIVPYLSFGIKTLVKAGLAHVVKTNIDTLNDDLDKELQKATDKTINYSVEKLLSSHIDAEKNIKALKAIIQDLAATKPLVIFIDELDRCRPDFALSMLETIKHTFNIDGVKFVLIANKEQLLASINNCYGSAINSEIYLNKFIKFSFSLPNTVNTSERNNTPAAFEHFNNLIKNSEHLKNTNLNKDKALELASNIIKTNNLSLREIERFIRYAEIYQVISNNIISEQYRDIYDIIVPLGVFISSCKPKLANDIINNKLDAKDLGNFLGVKCLSVFEDNNTSYLNQYSILKSPNEILIYTLAPSCFLNMELYIPQETDNDSWLEEVHKYCFHQTDMLHLIFYKLKNVVHSLNMFSV